MANEGGFNPESPVTALSDFYGYRPLSYVINRGLSENKKTTLLLSRQKGGKTSIINVLPEMIQNGSLPVSINLDLLGPNPVVPMYMQVFNAIFRMLIKREIIESDNPYYVAWSKQVNRGDLSVAMEDELLEIGSKIAFYLNNPNSPVTFDSGLIESDWEKLQIFIKRNFLSVLTGNKKSEKHEFEQVKKLADKINTNQTQVEALKNLTMPYLQMLNHYQLREKYITKYLVNGKFIIDYILFLFLLIPAIPALLLNSWPYFIALKIAKKTAKKAEFFSSVNIGAAGILYFLWYIVLLILFAAFLPFIKVLMLVIVLHFSGIIALHLASQCRAIKSHFKISRLSKIEKENILNTRMICVEAIQKFVQP